MLKGKRLKRLALAAGCLILLVIGQFLSDLGRRTTVDGKDNTLCSPFFSRPVVGLAVALVPFLPVMPATFKPGRVLHISSIMFAVGLLGIGLTPSKDHFVLPHVAPGIGFVALLVVGECLVLPRPIGW